ncbi:MAG: hypothetical protein ACOYJU_05455 [Anaerovoracaceae bacterium]|jgi:hypothetical protein
MIIETRTVPVIFSILLKTAPGKKTFSPSPPLISGIWRFFIVEENPARSRTPKNARSPGAPHNSRGLFSSFSTLKKMKWRKTLEQAFPDALAAGK